MVRIPKLGFLIFVGLPLLGVVLATDIVICVDCVGVAAGSLYKASKQTGVEFVYVVFFSCLYKVLCV